MKKLNIFLGNEIFEELDGDTIAVDCFAMKLIEAGYKNFTSIGDFDSCTSEELSIIETNTNCIKYPSKKNEGDLELAFIYAIENNYDKVVVYNIYCGNRVDHLLNNFSIFKKYHEKLDIEIKDRNNLICFLKNDHIVKNSEYDYVSLLIMEDVEDLCISDDFKYSYKGNVKSFDPRFISNELVSSSGVITFKRGVILLVLSSD